MVNIRDHSERRPTLDEVTVTRGVNDGDVVLGSLELPEGNVDRDTTVSCTGGKKIRICH
jgi:hypothetical protein